MKLYVQNLWNNLETLLFIAKNALSFLHLYLQSMSVVAKIIISCYNNILVAKICQCMFWVDQKIWSIGDDIHSNESNQVCFVFNKRKYISNGSIKHGFCKHRWMYIWQMFVQSYIILLQISKFPFRALKFKLELNLANVGIILQSVWNPSGNQFEKFLVTSGYCKISFS